LKAVFLDYDTVSNGDLDLSALTQAVEDLRLFEANQAHAA
jgi:hypothetical protein